MVGERARKGRIVPFKEFESSLKSAREDLTGQMRKMDIAGPQYAASQILIEAIDKFAVSSGAREDHFHTEMRRG